MDDDDQCPGTNRKGERCGHPAGWGTDSDSGPCKFHGGASPGAPEGNDNAATHEAFREFFAETLTDEEAHAVRNAERLLEDEASAQRLGRTAAGLCLTQFRRTGDERFLRRMESICDTFGLAPEDAVQVEHSGTVDHEHSHDLTPAEKTRLDQLLGGGAVEVESVETIDE